MQHPAYPQGCSTSPDLRRYLVRYDYAGHNYAVGSCLPHPRGPPFQSSRYSAFGPDLADQITRLIGSGKAYRSKIGCIISSGDTQTARLLLRCGKLRMPTPHRFTLSRVVQSGYWHASPFKRSIPDKKVGNSFRFRYN